jgi:regulator of protease activity HflC (stomatin/prohibitin superfamily)
LRLAELSSHNVAAKRGPGLGLVAALAATGASAVTLSVRSGDGAASMAASLGAALGVMAAGYAGSAIIAGGRTLALRGEQFSDASGAMSIDPARLRAGLDRQAKGRMGWQQSATGGVIALLAFCAAAWAFSDLPAWHRSANIAAAAAASLFTLAFGLLVLERHLAGADAAELPEAPALAALVRVPIAVSLICGIGCLLLFAGVGAGAYAGRLAALLCLAAAGEQAVRALATLFVPFPPMAEARLTVISAAAGALVLRRPQPVTATMRDLFGIDLSRSWALAFMRAAFLPVLAALLLFGWGLSGVEALHVDQRAVYERFGKPVAVFGPGLHLRLPWPAGRLRPVELGVMHDVPIVFDVAGAAGTPSPPGTVPGAEAEPGQEADRLWDEAHPSEAAYLVASRSQGRQSFESIDIDLRVVYRVGLSDADALRAAFAISNPQRLVQARTSRLLAHYFADHTLPGILGSDRATFSHDIAASLQAELDTLQSGIEVMAVVVEAIHPPPGAAAAYHAVQSAQIGAHTQIAEQAGIAVKTEIDARRDADGLTNAAVATSRETVVDASVRATAFAADRTADLRDHASFVLERRLDKLSAGLAHKQVIIIDHRLGSAAAPTLDMRPTSGGSIFVPPPSQQP